MEYLQSKDGGKVFSNMLPYVKVFARVAPKQKVSASDYKGLLCEFCIHVHVSMTKFDFAGGGCHIL